MSRSAQGSISSLCSRTRPPVRRHPAATAPSTTTSPPATCWTRCRIRGAEAARRVFNALLENHPNEKVAANTLFVLEELRKQLESERDRLSQQVFANLLEACTMRFIVVTDDLQFNRLPVQIESPATERQANREDVQGWKPRRIHADFILTLQQDEPNADDEFHQVFVVETKGVHLKDSADTAYKRSVFDVCSQHAKKTNWAAFVPAMHNTVMRFEVVDEEEWEQRLNA